MRVRRDILRRSTIGVIATNRSPAVAGSGSSQLFGVDATLAFFQNLTINTYYAESRTPDETRDESSYMGQLAYAGDRYGLHLERLSVGEAFNPEIGFFSRRAFERSLAQVRFSPRPKAR